MRTGQPPQLLSSPSLRQQVSALASAVRRAAEKRHRAGSTLTTPASLKKKKKRRRSWEKASLEEHYAPSTRRQAESLPGGRSDAGGCEMANATESESPGVTSRECGLCGPLALAASLSGTSSFTGGRGAQSDAVQRDLPLLCRFLEEGKLAVEDQNDLGLIISKKP